MNKTREEQLEAIRGKCRLANPEKRWSDDDKFWEEKVSLTNLFKIINYIAIWGGATVAGIIGWWMTPNNLDGIMFGALMFSGTLAVLWDKE